MARVNSALFQSGRGSIGNIIFSDYVDGDMIARSKPQDVANPRTPGQQNQRGVFTLIQNEARDLLQLLRTSFEPLSNDQNGYTSYISKGIKSFKELSGDYASYCENRLITRGSRPISPVVNTNIEFNAGPPEEVGNDVGWVLPTGSMEQYEDDEAVVVMYNPFTRTFFMDQSSTRSVGSASWLFPTEASLPWAFVYLFFRDPVTGAVSDSQYLGAYEDKTTAYQYDDGLPPITPPVPVPAV